MDPEVALALAADPTLSPAERASARRDLRAWLRLGGYLPTPRTRQERIILGMMRKSCGR